MVLDPQLLKIDQDLGPLNGQTSIGDPQHQAPGHSKKEEAPPAMPSSLVLTCLDARSDPGEYAVTRPGHIEVETSSIGLGYVNLQHVLAKLEPPELWTKHGDLNTQFHAQLHLTHELVAAVTVLLLSYGLGQQDHKQQEQFTPIGDLYRMTDTALLQPEPTGGRLKVPVVWDDTEKIWNLRLKIALTTGTAVSKALARHCYRSPVY